MTIGITVASLLIFVGLALVLARHWGISVFNAGLHLRSDAKTVSLTDARTMAVSRGFYDANLNPSGRVYPINTRSRPWQDEAVVVDGATELMWQIGGSARNMDRQDAKDYVRSLNARKFNGFDDWRLPTLEEAMSLMTPTEDGQQRAVAYDDEVRKVVFHISPQFAIAGAWSIWTADADSSGRGGTIFFEGGFCRAERVIANYYVRAVRSVR
jgi:serine/threonine-protein kinase